MKTLVMLILSLSTTAFAQTQFDVETKTFPSSMSVMDMKCVTPIASGNDSYTEVDHDFKRGFNAIELDHRAATATGCNMEALEELVTRAHQRFGYASVKVTVIKFTAKIPRIYNGICQRYYKEQLELNLGNDIILTTPVVATTKPAENCE